MKEKLSTQNTQTHHGPEIFFQFLHQKYGM